MAAPPLDSDDLLDAILLRLPPKPSSLPRASAVCRRWRRIVSDPVFLRRFRVHHRRDAPILGCFLTDRTRTSIFFEPTLDPLDRVPAGRFYLQLDDCDRFRSLNCRHGLVLMLLWHQKELLVWDPITGDKHRIPLPGGFVREETRIDGAVLRAAGVDDHFQVVLVGFDEEDPKRVIACVYSSETGLWGNLVSNLRPDEVLGDTNFTGVPAVLVGDSIYWVIVGGSSRVLGFDLHRQMLTVMSAPVDINKEDRYQFTFMRPEGGGLGFLVKSGWKVQLYERETYCDGFGASWAPGRTIDLDELLSQDPKKASSFILGYAEYSNVMFLWIVKNTKAEDHFMVQLESLEYKNIFDTFIGFVHQPFECVYTGEMGIGGAPGGADA